MKLPRIFKPVEKRDIIDKILIFSMKVNVAIIIISIILTLIGVIE